jgi:hypothetical protein
MAKGLGAGAVLGAPREGAGTGAGAGAVTGAASEGAELELTMARTRYTSDSSLISVEQEVRQVSTSDVASTSAMTVQPWHGNL